MQCLTKAKGALVGTGLPHLHKHREANYSANNLARSYQLHNNSIVKYFVSDVSQLRG